MFGVVTLTGYQVEDIRVAQIGEPYRSAPTRSN
jgi:hypothetical protein